MLNNQDRSLLWSIAARASAVDIVECLREAFEESSLAPADDEHRRSEPTVRYRMNVALQDVVSAERHEADAWIEALWMGRDVRQETGTSAALGRSGKVTETSWDERGALRCLVVGASSFWCPAADLAHV